MDTTNKTIMDVPAPTVKGFVLRLMTLIAAGAGVAGLANLFFYRLVVQVTSADQKVISNRGVPVSVLGSFVFLAIILIIARPLFRYIRAVRSGGQLDAAAVARVQDQAVNLGTVIAVVSCLFYLTVTPSIFYLGIRNLNWDLDMMSYGVAGGAISGLFMIPIGINFGAWLTRAIVEHTAGIMPAIQARRAGRRLSLSFKMLATFTPMITSLLLFGSLIGYAQTKTIFRNMEVMEKTFLNDAERARLTATVIHKSDPGVRSSAYYRDHVQNLRFSYTVFLSAGVLVSLIFIVFAAAETTRPLRVLTGHAREVQGGRFEQSVRLVTNDELSELGAAMNQMKDTIIRQMGNMTAVIARLREGIARLDGVVDTVLKVSGDQSSGATEQASAVAQAAAVSDRILASAQTIAELAQAVDQSSASTFDACQAGEFVLERAQAGFDEIAARTRDIVAATAELEHRFAKTYGIVELIEEIADQTQLLAFNASLEAAGAGSVGERFAVVAEETTRLARRTTAATKLIRELIASIEEATARTAAIAKQGADKVGAGGQAVAEADQSLASISKLAASTSEQVRNISIATQEQTTATRELSESISEVNEVAGQVEDGARELARAVAELKNFADLLRDTVESSSE